MLGHLVHLEELSSRFSGEDEYNPEDCDHYEVGQTMLLVAAITVLL